MVQTGKMRQGFRGSSPRVWPFLLEKGSIMVWSPDTYSCWNTWFIIVWCWLESSRLKVPKDRGWHIWGFIPREGGSRPCLAESQGGSRGVPPEAFPCGSRKFLSLTICWKSKETIRAFYGFSCITCHSLMVVTTVWMVAIVGISAKCLCWLRFISLVSKCFPTLCTYSNNIKEIFLRIKHVWLP